MTANDLLATATVYEHDPF